MGVNDKRGERTEMTEKTNGGLILFPAFTEAAQLAEQYHRLRWYVPDGSGYRVTMFHTGIPQGEVDSAMENGPEYIDTELPGGRNIEVMPWSSGSLLKAAARSSAVAVWKTGSAKMLDKLSVAAGRRFIVVDPHARGTWEYVRYAAFLYDHMSGTARRALHESGKRSLGEAAAKLAGLRKAYVFGTGPSLSQAVQFDYSDGVRIVCNSIVRNPELLEHIKPHFIAASDFVFHFGPSRYAGEFRRDLVRALESTGAYFLVPDQLAPVMLAHYPEIAGRTIAIPLTNRYDLRSKRGPVNVQLLDRFKVNTLDSVLNLLMLPVASTLADEVYVIGCDGRKPSDNGFWSHHAASQYAGLMKTVSDAHPGFFDVDYVDYYERYCSHVAAVISAGEALGKRYASLVPSHIPALSARTGQG